MGNIFKKANRTILVAGSIMISLFVYAGPIIAALVGRALDADTLDFVKTSQIGWTTVQFYIVKKLIQGDQIDIAETKVNEK